MSEPNPLRFFGSATITGHLLRGAAAATLFTLAIQIASSQPTLSILAGVGGLVMLRGCPMCWTLGLIETVVRRLKAT